MCVVKRCCHLYSLGDIGMSTEHRWNDTDRGNYSTRKKNHPSATGSITNTSRSSRASNPGLRGQKLAINGLNRNMAFEMWELHWKMFLHHEDVQKK